MKSSRAKKDAEERSTAGEAWGSAWKPPFPGAPQAVGGTAAQIVDGIGDGTGWVVALAPVGEQEAE